MEVCNNNNKYHHNNNNNNNNNNLNNNWLLVIRELPQVSTLLTLSAPLQVQEPLLCQTSPLLGIQVSLPPTPLVDTRGENISELMIMGATRTVSEHIRMLVVDVACLFHIPQVVVRRAMQNPGGMTPKNQEVIVLDDY